MYQQEAMNTTPYDYSNLSELLAFRAECSADSTAYAFLASSDSVKHALSNRMLLQEAQAVGAWLVDATAPADRILLLFPQSPAFVYAYWGCQWAGRIAVPLPPPRTAHIVRTLRYLADVAASAQGTTVLTTAAIFEVVRPLINDIPALLALQWACIEDFEPAPCFAAAPGGLDDTAMLQFTSGSTGLPKGVMLSHRNLLQNARYFDTNFVHGDDARVLTWLPPFHDLGLIYGMITPVLRGVPAYILPRGLFAQRPARWIEAIDHFRITHTAGPDFGYRLAAAGIDDAQLATLDLSCVVSALNGAEPVRLETIEQFSAKFASVGFQRRAFCPAWGLAEAACIVTGAHCGSPGPTIDGRPDVEAVFIDSTALAARRLSDCDRDAPGARAFVSNGRGIDATELRIVDPDTRRECDVDAIGEVWVRSPCVAAGYWNNPEATAASFGARIEGADDDRAYMRTGDLGFLRESRLYICGRIKDLIIVRGQNHYPQDIERTVEEAHSQIQAGNIAAFGVEADGEECVALVAEVNRRFSADHCEDVFSALRRAVAETHGVKLAAISLIRFGTLTKTTSGKIQRSKARQEFMQGELTLVGEWRGPELTRKTIGTSVDAQATPATVDEAPGQTMEPTAEAAAENRHQDAHAIARWLSAWVAQYSGLDAARISHTRVFGEFGLDSMAVMQLVDQAAQHFGKAGVAESAVYDHPTIEALARYIARRKHVADTSQPAAAPGRMQAGLGILGMAVRVPGATGLDAFWALLEAGRRTISTPSPGRTTLLARLGAQCDGALAGYLDDIEQFDPAFFRIGPREAEQMDPQQRLLLMAVWHAIEDAGLTRADLAGSRTGVFVGVCSADYAALCMRPDFTLDGHAAAGMANAIIANRVSYFLDLHGPSMVVDTACSSSLVALHEAVRSLRAGDCELAIVAGVQLVLNPTMNAVGRRAGMLSPHGACESFDVTADGYVRSEGVCAVVLGKADGRDAHARIAGSAVNQDGRSFGLTAPNGEAQRAVMRAALADAGLQPHQVQAIEAHGTGTPLGDPLEFSALADIYGEGRDTPAWLGSVKSNIGHLEAAAGLAGVIKAALCLRHGMVPPLAGFSAANPRLQATTGLTLATTATSVALRHIAVTSMGFGGTNAHVLLEAADTAPDAPANLAAVVLPVSADSPGSLARLATTYADRIESEPASWSSLAISAATRRSALDCRAAAVGDDADHLVRELRLIASGAPDARIVRAPRVAFVFSGQGAQTLSMGCDFYARSGVFRAQVQACDAILRRDIGISVIDLFDGSAVDAEDSLAQTVYAQLAIVVCQLGLVAWMKACAIEPSSVYGHSLGEYVAAHVAGALDLHDLLRLVHLRGQAMDAAPQGGMLAVRATLAHVEQMLGATASTLEIAGINSAEDIAVSGDPDALERFAAHCRDSGVICIRVRVARAFHSRHMDGAADAVSRIALPARRPRIALYGNLDGVALETVDAGYWSRHLRGCVNFSACTASALADGAEVLLEIGGDVLRGFLAKNSAGRARVAAIAPGRREWLSAMQALAELFRAGAVPDWRAVYADSPCRTPLPSYPFDTTPHWLDRETQSSERTMQTTTVSFPATTAARTGPVEPSTTHASWLPELRDALGKLLKLAPDAVNNERSFLDQGADSLVLTEFLQQAKALTGIELPLADLFDRLINLQSLAQWLDARAVPPSKDIHTPRPAAAAAAAQSASAPSTAAASITAPVTASQAAVSVLPATGTMQGLMQEQLAVFERLVQSQLGVLSGSAAHTVHAPAAVEAPAPAARPDPQPSHPALMPTQMPAGPLAAGPAAALNLSATQQAHLRELTAAYCAKTAGSKQYAIDHRTVFADYRSSLGFRQISKEMTYPLVVERGAGSRIFDVDGHEYIDLTMAFGSCLLGHNPPAVIAALHAQLADGIQVGPKSPLSGRAAHLVAELTGMARVAFANSGTEAAMTAVRMARAVTGKTRYVRFTGSYHGHADSVLVRAGKDGVGTAMTPGVPAAVAAEALVLDYGSDEALEHIDRHGAELAAVLVEPVQSRRPGLQPASFLRRLRELADVHGFALIFDEIITGFRLARGGAQEYFGVDADLAVYGKVAGGGMPLGIVAGIPRFMNAIDGGAWRYGDESAPQQPTTFFAGTFSGHPLTMAATVAALEHVREHATTLYPALNRRTREMTARINAGFAAEGLPIHVDCAGSLFRFVFMKNFSVEFQPVEAPLFFYHMALNGIYIWEGHTCFLSESHSDADIDAIVHAALNAGRALRAGGFLSGGTPGPAAPSDHARTDALNHAAKAGFAAALAAMAPVAHLAERPSAETLGQRLGVVATRERLWLALCGHLSAAGLIGGDQRAIVSIATTDARTARTAFIAALDAARALGESTHSLTLLTRCVDALPLVLTGKASGTEALFANGGMALVAAVYTGAPGAVVTHEALQRTFADTVARLASPERPLRILEVGAGTGGTTRTLLPLLAGKTCRYTFSDISPAFLRDAEKTFGHLGFVDFVTFDLESHIEHQRLPFEQFDIVIAANVVHATSELRASLDRLHELLAPGGEMMLIECARPHAWLDMVFGLTDGWWRFTDTGLRQHPLMDADTWRTVLGSQGWGDIAIDTHADSMFLIRAEKRASASAGARAPLSVMQQEILVHMGMDDAVLTAYNEGALFDVQGPVDHQHLQSTLVALVNDHESLASVVDEDGRHLRLRAATAPVLVQIDFSAFPLQVGLRKAREWLKLRIAEPFDLGREPLLRTYLIRFGDDRHWLYLVGHHLIIDGTAFGTLAVEWMQRYEAAINGATATLPKPLTVAEANRRQAVWRPEDRDFWMQALHDLPPPLALPTDRAFPPEQTFGADRVPIEFPRELGARLSAFCRSAGVTPFMALFGAWRVLLHKWCGQHRSIIGVPAAVHGTRSGERYIGFGVNVLAVAGETDPATSWHAHLAATRGELLKCLEHRAYPMPELLRELKPTRDLARPTLVSVLFNYEPIGALHAGDATLLPIVPPVIGTKYELTLDTVGSGDDYQAVLTYNRALFDEQTARDLLGRYVALIERLIDAPDAPLGAHPILLDGECPWLIGEAVPALSESDHIAARVALQAARTPDAVALRWHDVEVSYRELDRRAEALAQRLVAMGVGAGQRVAVRLPRTPALPIALLAVLKTGAAYAPLDINYPQERQAAILACAQADLIIVDAEYAHSHPSMRTLQVDVAGRADGTALSADASRLPWHGSPQQLSHLIFTSGSTGTPKGVAIRQSSVLNLLDWASGVFSDADIAGVVASTSICFDLSVFELFVPLTRGGRVVLVENALQLTELARTDDITLINTVPSAMAELVRAEALPASLRTINLAGEALSAELVARIHALRSDVAVYNLYGPSEDTTYSTFVKVPVGCPRVTIGGPIGGTALYLMDEGGRNAVPAGTIGVIHLAGAGLAEGYFGEPGLTEAAFVADPIGAVPGKRMYNTGDLGRLNRSGEVEYLGRSDGQVKIRGHRIETAEIEAVIARVPGVDKTQVLAAPDDAGDAALIAFYSSAPDAGDPADAIREAISAALPRYMMPSQLLAIEAFPLTQNGKTDRRRLLEWSAAHRSGARRSDAPAAAPATAAEAQLVELWRELLGVTEIDPTDNFFELGGHSLMATRLVTEMSRRFGHSVRLTDILRAPTIRQLARALER